MSRAVEGFQCSHTRLSGLGRCGLSQDKGSGFYAYCTSHTGIRKTAASPATPLSYVGLSVSPPVVAALAFCCTPLNLRSLLFFAVHMRPLLKWIYAVYAFDNLSLRLAAIVSVLSRFGILNHSRSELAMIFNRMSSLTSNRFV
jgi:hypothetical protein